jgi:hypothetical protein
MVLKITQKKELADLLMELKSEYLELKNNNKIYSLKELSMTVNAILHFNSSKYIDTISLDAVIVKVKTVKRILELIKKFNKKEQVC